MKTRIFKLVLGVFITLISFSVSAQNYEYIPLVKQGLQLWTCDKGYYGHNDEAYRFKRFALTDEDTMIDNETYKKLYFYRDVEFNPSTATYIGALRENSQKQVFYRGLNGYRDMDDSPHAIQELNEMIYDFSLSVGDTLPIGYFNMSPEIILSVGNIDTINNNGIERRRFTIQTIGGSIVGFWIEGIGNREGLFFPFHITTADIWGNTRCYIHNGELLYSNYTHGGNDCITPLMGIECIVEDNSITIYPNPTSSNVNISSENIINSIEIYNSLGQRVYQSVVNSNTKTIDISSFTNGVYILGVNTENGVIRKKIIKN